VINIYRKSDGKHCTCDRDQLAAMTEGEDAAYTTVKPVVESSDEVETNETEVDETEVGDAGEDKKPAKKKSRKKKSSDSDD
jgi:hypothetical protein